MSETIKANEITPGMVIEWTDRGTFTRLTVESYNPSLSAVRSVGGAVRYLASGTDVEVIAAPPVMSPEPEALGARVKAGDKLFLRAYDDGCGWVEARVNATGLAYTWREVNEFGPVTVIDGNPSWTVPASQEPIQKMEDQINEWDTWEEVPEGVTVANRKMCYYYRKAGSRVEALSPFNDVVMGGTGLYLRNRPGPWTRVTTNTISHEKKENV